LAPPNLPRGLFDGGNVGEHGEVDAMWRKRLQLQNQVNALTEQNRLFTESAAATAIQLNERDEHIRLLTESATETAIQLNERDEHIRVLTESATAMVPRLQEQGEHIRAMTLRLQEQDEHIRVLTESTTATAVQRNERDEHIRVLIENATAMTLRLQQQDEQIVAMRLKVEERDAEIVELAKRAAELEKHNRASIVMDARLHLDKALSQISAKQPSYGSRWQPQVDAIRRDIPALRDSLSCLHYAQKNITFDGRPPFPSDVMQIQFREWAVENEFPDLAPVLRKLYDNSLSYPESLGEFNGRTVSRIFYCHARIALAGITYANRPKRILEIGGGYGEIARLWLTNSIAPAESYVIVDIPECLFFAEIALRAEFGSQVGYFEGHDPGTRILLVPIPSLGDLTRPADLVVNTGSMQEMTDEWIDFYTEWLTNYDTRYFYSLNYVAQPISVMGESRNLWSQRLGAEWSTRHLRLDIPLLDLEGPARDFLEVMYEKSPATGRLKEWSIYRGHLLSKTTYVEGLDLLRQDFTIENAKTFVNVVMEKMPYHPKELLYIVEWLTRQGETEFESLRGKLREELGGFLSHEPAPAKNI
jgi:putative sugar O-methyltransferase